MIAGITKTLFYFLLTFAAISMAARSCTAVKADDGGSHHQNYRPYIYAPQYYPYAYSRPYSYVSEWDIMQAMDLAEGIGKEMLEAELDAQAQLECEKLNRVAAHGESLWAERNEEVAAEFRTLRKDCTGGSND